MMQILSVKIKIIKKRDKNKPDRNLEKIIVMGRIRCARLSYAEVNNSTKQDKKIINRAFASRLPEQNSSRDLDLRN